MRLDRGELSLVRTQEIPRGLVALALEFGGVVVQVHRAKEPRHLALLGGQGGMQGNVLTVVLLDDRVHNNVCTSCDIHTYYYAWHYAVCLSCSSMYPFVRAY